MTPTLVFIVAFGYYAHGFDELDTKLCVFVNNNISMHHIPDEEFVWDANITEMQGAEPYKQEKCPKATNYCYALWKEETVDNSTVITTVAQGCWEVSGNANCKSTKCVGGEMPSQISRKKNYKFCCCSGDLCNANVSSDPFVSPTVIPTDVEHSTRDTDLLFILMPTMLIILGVSCGGIWYYMFKKVGFGKSKLSPDSVHLMENGGLVYNSSNYTLDHLKLSGIVGQGRYGCVWKGTLHDQEVAVKIFPSHYRSYFQNECELYSLPFMDNPALLTYFGCDERIGIEGCVEYLLVLSYAPQGCLQDYLRSNILDWPTFCKMSLSVAKGLAHLHTDIIKGDKVKPAITHRDLNTRNILVKGDLSCCLCDFGFSMKIQGSKYVYNGEEQHAETKSINDVGTLRYMAPEVLEGAVNLRDCESSLKQIDVYALGLVLWELATRCSDLFIQGAEVEPYQLPFETEVGHHPTFEQMQVLVSRHKARPLFPQLWRDLPAVRLIKETIEDSWDQDAEARLTALCVEERLQELPSLWDRHRGVSPTINSTFPGNIQNQGFLSRIGIENNIANITGEGTRTLFDTGSSVQSASHSSAILSKDGLDSDGTVETLITMSPTEPSSEIPNKNSNRNAVMNGSQTQHIIQPYQGRNPCMERNLMMQVPSEEELLYSGNTLVEKSLKHVPSHYVSSPFESQSLISSDFLNVSQSTNTTTVPRSATPIPYVQNVVYDSHPSMPKQSNIPVNNCNIASTENSRKVETNGWMIWGNNSGKWNGLKKFMDSKRFFLFGMHSSKNVENHKKNAIKSKTCNQRETDETKSNLLINQNGLELSPPLKKSPVIVETQVSLVPCGMMNGGTNTNEIITIVTSSNLNSEMKNILDGVNNLENGSNDNENVFKEIKNKRPSTLPLVSLQSKNVSPTSSVSSSRQSLEEHFQKVFGSKTDCDTSRLKDPHSRVKTPGDVPPSVRRIRGKANAALRFSLYDDRIMCTGENIRTSPITMSNGSINLSNSVPSNIDVSSCCESATSSLSKEAVSDFQIVNDDTYTF